jgi:isopentenyl diphosphate isomerase/L-lactate dehydrogenase-like FMN-dependent dehydrogenase
MLDLMRSGMERTMALVGSATVDDLDPELVRLGG